MPEIRRLRPKQQIRRIQPLPDKGDEPTRSQARGGQFRNVTTRTRNLVIVRRFRKDFLPPTPLDTPCVLWQGGVDPDGYGRRKIKVDGEWKTVAMHRWIVEQVTGRKLRSDQHIMHRCDNPPCYRFDHLKIGTLRENTRDMVNKKRNKKPPVHRFLGESNPQAKLTAATVLHIRLLRMQGFSHTAIAAEVGVARQTITKICNDKAWAQGPFPYGWRTNERRRVRADTDVAGRRARTRRAARAAAEAGREAVPHGRQLEAGEDGSVGPGLAPDPPVEGRQPGGDGVRPGRA